MNRWDWHEYYSSDNAIARFECTGFSFEEKGPYQTFHLADIPTEARRTLADKLHLPESNFEDWAALDRVDACQESYDFVISVYKAWYKATTENWNWERTDGDGKETAEYSCPGWKCDREIFNKILDNRLTFHDIPLKARENLAQMVGLDEREIDKWGKDLQGWIDGDGIRVTVRVPNVWITANILAFDLSFNGFFAAVGGIIGAAGTSVGNAFSGMMEVKCRNFAELLSKLDDYKGKIRGFTLYAHGGENGAIAETPQGVQNWQENLIFAIWQNNYKLAEINLMQCFSGFAGETMRLEKCLDNETFIEMKKRLKLKYLSYPFIHVDDIEIKRTPNNTFYANVKITVNWASAWNTVGLNVKTYTGMNVCLIDTYFLTNLLPVK